MILETVARPQPPAKPSIDYEKELLLHEIVDWLCDDNKIVRGMIRERIVDYTAEELKDYALKNNIPLIN